MKSLPALLLFFVPFFAPAQTPVPAADAVLQEAAKVAAKEKKNILVLFTASWCVWCKRMDRSMADTSCKGFFDDNYVPVHLTVHESRENVHLENPGGLEWLKKYKAEDAGIPFWVVLDPQLNLLADSYVRKPGVPLSEPGDNIGCPASAEEVKAFIDILRKTSRLRERELEIIARRFRQNQN
ncbi:MAG TPA: thioredoxin family protein [Lacibacter sp.]|nr:thioredoxin family protein [Lacibacter sp.]HMO87548.1 thioredoxin family protein [Lacibacter sp.]